jgi:hypothetical protein
VSELERQLHASLARLDEADTEPPPPTVASDPVEEAAFQMARHTIRMARAPRAVRPWSSLSEFQKARFAIAELDRLITLGDNRDVWLWVRETTIAGLSSLVRDMLRSQGDI